MSDEMKKRENTVFAQEPNEDELDQVAGGVKVEGDHATSRDIYDGKFPNCAATVESGSWCWSNDACLSGAVVYRNMKSCFKAWE